MHGAVVGEVVGQLVPLAARSRPENHGVERRPRVDAATPCLGRWIVLGKDALDHRPQIVRHGPEGGEAFGVGVLALGSHAKGLDLLRFFVKAPFEMVS